MKKSALLLIMFTVAFFYAFSGTGECHSITMVEFSPASPATLPFNARVGIKFDYTTTQAGGVRIFARPFTGSALTPNYAAHGSIVHPTGSGSVTTAYFTITSGAVTVDRIRFQMWNAAQTNLLLEIFIPVQFIFRTLANAISNIQLTPPSPASLAFGDRVNISFNYTTNQAGGVRIFARPFTNGSLTPNYAAHGSALHPVGSGSVTSAYFTISSGDVTVDQIRFQMWNAAQTVLLYEIFRAVSYVYAVAVSGGGGGGCFIESIQDWY